MLVQATGVFGPTVGLDQPFPRGLVSRNADRTCGDVGALRGLSLWSASAGFLWSMGSLDPLEPTSADALCEARSSAAASGTRARDLDVVR